MPIGECIVVVAVVVVVIIIIIVVVLFFDVVFYDHNQPGHVLHGRKWRKSIQKEFSLFKQGKNHFPMS